MDNTPKLQLDQFIKKYASELYQTELKRKAYYPKILTTIISTVVISTSFLIISFSIDRSIGVWFFMSILLVIIIGIVLSLYLWNKFRELHKEMILEILVKEYFPQLTYTYIKKELVSPNFNEYDYITGIGYWPEHKSYRFYPQDFIEGSVGQLEISLCEALIQYHNPSNDWQNLFQGILLEMRGIPASADLKDLKSRAKIKKALNDIFDFYKKDYPQLFASSNGNWYLFLEHSKTYLEPRGIKKSWSQEELERLLGEFYHFIQFAEVLNTELGESKALKEGD